MASPAEALREAARIIEERHETHGDYRETFTKCAELWSGYLGIPISPIQVCHLNQIQKMARDLCGPEINIENHNDNTGFAAIAAAFAAAIKGGNDGKV